MKDFKGKVAVITGAASGIGRAIAERCIKEEVKVVLADVEAAALEQTVTELRALGGNVLGVKTDVSKRNDVETLAKNTIDTYGSVHLLFNNAGIGAGGLPWMATWNDWEWTINVNLWGVINGVKIFTPIMLSQNTACHIVNTSSIAGLMVGGGLSPYAATKHAVVALSESLYLSLEQQKAPIKVSVLCPSFVKTKILDSERNRPVELKNEVHEITPEVRAILDYMNAAVESGTPPSQIADRVFEAIIQEKFYIIPHPETIPAIQLRMDCILKGENPKNPMDRD